jgi:uncharacterized protein
MDRSIILHKGAAALNRNLWHYPRTELAESFYRLLIKGPVQAISLFGPRRTGKTQFLTQDLAPLAEERGHKVVYASLWQTIDSPLGILLYELDMALRGGSVLNRLKTFAGDIAPKFSLKAPLGGPSVEVDLAKLKGKSPESHLLLLDQYCEKLSNKRRPAFLLLDEFQEIARSDGAKPLMAALRTSLDKRKDGLVAVFTGSSQEGLRQMFSARQAPFFRFAQPMELPPLDDAFVLHQLKAMRSTSKAKVDRTEAIAVFEECGRNPLVFQRWLMILALHPGKTGAQAIDEVRAGVAEEFGYVARWLDLTPLQRLAARLLADGVARLYSKEAAEQAEQLIGSSAPSASKLQTAMERLNRLGLVDEFERAPRLNDPLFAGWVRQRPGAEF